jgi:hypothetical protein
LFCRPRESGVKRRDLWQKIQTLAGRAYA